MRKIILFAVVSVLFAGCASFKTEKVPVDELSIEKRMGETMIEAFGKQDFEGFIQYIPAGGRQVYGQNKFKEEQRQIASRLGKIVSYRFLTKLEMEPAHQLVWAVRFKSYTLKGEETFKEAIFTVVIGKVDEQRKVFLFGFK